MTYIWAVLAVIAVISTRGNGQARSGSPAAPSASYFPRPKLFGDPSAYPTAMPFGDPSMYPTTMPFSDPSMYPTTMPFGDPSMYPAVMPFGDPSMYPGVMPFGDPSAYPTMMPFEDPASCGKPSTFPGSMPFGDPSTFPGSMPFGDPSAFLGAMPFGDPSAFLGAMPFTSPFMAGPTCFTVCAPPPPMMMFPAMPWPMPTMPMPSAPTCGPVTVEPVGPSTEEPVAPVPEESATTPAEEGWPVDGGDDAPTDIDEPEDDIPIGTTTETFVEEITEPEIILNECQVIADITECVTSPACGFCNTEEFPSIRCDLRENLEPLGCAASDVFDSSVGEVLVTPRESGSPALLVNVLPGVKKNITVTFELGKHPVDVYYLAQYTHSMKDYRDELPIIGADLVRVVEEMSPDFTFGFGAFADKPVLPFGAVTKCYSFQNLLPLSKDTSTFEEIADKTATMNGRDTLHSGGDAMFQVAACTSEIGWRNYARHLLVVVTDDGFHVAGDGPAGKINTPFDGRCHLGSDGKYTEEKTLDYPSVSQIVSAVEANKINVIFALTDDSASGNYTSLIDQIEPSAAAILSDDIDTNVLELVKNVYKDLTSTVELERTATSDEFEITYFSKCDGAEEKETNKCELPEDGTITYTVEVDMKSCPKDPMDRKQRVTISPVGLPTHVDIDISSLCEE